MSGQVHGVLPKPHGIWQTRSHRSKTTRRQQIPFENKLQIRRNSISPQQATCQPDSPWDRPVINLFTWHYRGLKTDLSKIKHPVHVDALNFHELRWVPAQMVDGLTMKSLPWRGQGFPVTTGHTWASHTDLTSDSRSQHMTEHG